MSKNLKLLLNTSVGILVFFLFLLGGAYSIAFALPSNFVKSEVAKNLNEPTDFTIAPDGRIFIAETGGSVKVIKNGIVLSQPFVTVPAIFQGDRGLLGITLDPDFASNKYVYLFYTANDPIEIRVSRFTESNDKAILGSEVILLRSTQPLNPIHHGGGLQFGADGKLWVSVGDNSNKANSQDLSNIHGKILRINKDGSVPSDNPFVNQPNTKKEIWSYGLRNPFRFSFMPNGKPIIGDVGGSLFEEVNIGVKAGNFGWPNVEGMCSTACPYINPIYTYPTGSGAALVGGFVYTKNNFPTEYKNNYFFGDYVQGFIKKLTLDSQGTVEEEQMFDDSAGTVVSLKEGLDGKLYFLTIFPGVLYKIEYSLANQPPIAKFSANPESGKAPLKVRFSSEGSVDPEGKKLSFKWNFGDGNSSKGKNPTHIFKKKGVYKVTLVAKDGKLESAPVTKDIIVGLTPPAVSILTPIEGVKYNAGDTINYSASAKDEEDGELPESSYLWNIIFHHADHIHPYLGPINGEKTGTFTTATTGEPSVDTYYEIQLTVTDSSGLKTTLSRNIYPNKVKLTIDTEPSALQIRVDGVLQIAPFTTEGVVGFKRDLDVESPQNKDGKIYQFALWSDGGAKNHQITTPAEQTIYTAKFTTTQTENPDVFEIKPGEKRSIKKYSVISGDVKVQGEALYDDNGDTGLAVMLNQDAEVEAPWGATVFTNPDLPNAENKLKEIVSGLKQFGCGNGCKEVVEVKWPKTEGVEATVNQGAPQPQSVNSPSTEPSITQTPKPSAEIITTPQPTSTVEPTSPMESSPSASPISYLINKLIISRNLIEKIVS